MTDEAEDELEAEFEPETPELWLSEGDAYFPNALAFFKAHPEVVFADRDIEGGVLFGVLGRGVVPAGEYLKGLGASVRSLRSVQ